ncbi:MAG: hypothetical protein HN417_01490 [Desulfobacula sp.]|nr:hypothetical protein [Desulfobacula sp.]
MIKGQQVSFKRIFRLIDKWNEPEVFRNIDRLQACFFQCGLIDGGQKGTKCMFGEICKFILSRPFLQRKRTGAKEQDMIVRVIQ